MPDEELREKDEELREKLDAILEAGKMMLNAPEDLAEFIDKKAVKQSRTDQILALIKQNYVRLAKDQSLPSVRNAVNKSYNDYMLGQEDMLKANFRKIEEE